MLGGFWRLLARLSSDDRPVHPIGPQGSRSFWPGSGPVLYSATEAPLRCRRSFHAPPLEVSTWQERLAPGRARAPRRPWKRVRQEQPPAHRQPACSQRGQDARPEHANAIALGRAEGDGTEAVTAAISALDRAAEKGIIHRNNAARRKSRLMAKANAAHLLDGAQAEAGPKKRSVATKTAQRKKVAAAKASKAASARAADRPRTAAGKAKVAVTRATRESAAARRRKQTGTDGEAPTES